MINVLIGDAYTDLVSTALIANAARAVLALHVTSEDVEITVVVEDDEHLRDLNQRFLGIDAPTDVLSFPADEMDPDSGLHYLGDIILSYPRAVEQAQIGGENPADEIQLLVVHGMLHLLGYDHGDDDEKALMWSAQQEVLDRLGCKIRHLPDA
jgi:probable rRNA maturation factor